MHLNVHVCFGRKGDEPRKARMVRYEADTSIPTMSSRTAHVVNLAFNLEGRKNQLLSYYDGPPRHLRFVWDDDSWSCARTASGDSGVSVNILLLFQGGRAQLYEPCSKGAFPSAEKI